VEKKIGNIALEFNNDSGSKPCPNDSDYREKGEKLLHDLRGVVAESV
jgi:hypothetical protein